jgi:hypothetical protein
MAPGQSRPATTGSGTRPPGQLASYHHSWPNGSDLSCRCPVISSGKRARRITRSLGTGFMGEHATSTAWMSDASALVVLTAAGLVAATRLPGWRLLALPCTGVYAHLAVVATAPARPTRQLGRPRRNRLRLDRAMFVEAMYAHRSLTPKPPRAAPWAGDRDEPTPAMSTPHIPPHDTATTANVPAPRPQTVWLNQPCRSTHSDRLCPARLQPDHLRRERTRRFRQIDEMRTAGLLLERRGVRADLRLS